MAGVYSQIYIHLIFAVKNRNAVISNEWSAELFRYIAGIVSGKEQKLIIVNGFNDHIHILLGLKPATAISDLVRDIKNNSTNFVNDRKFTQNKFSWQEGYGAFSYSRSQIESVYNYILNQEKHHKVKSFKEEYLEILNKFQIEFNDKYLFEWIE